MTECWTDHIIHRIGTLPHGIADRTIEKIECQIPRLTDKASIDLWIEARKQMDHPSPMFDSLTCSRDKFANEDKATSYSPTGVVIQAP